MTTPYPQSVELDIIVRDGLVSRYTGREFSSRDSSDIDHIVALSEAHDSGLCATHGFDQKSLQPRPGQLGVGKPTSLTELKRETKTQPIGFQPQNQCWFVMTIISVKRKYMLTIDEAERDAMQAVLEKCAATNQSLNSWGQVKATNHNTN